MHDYEPIPVFPPAGPYPPPARRPEPSRRWLEMSVLVVIILLLVSVVALLGYLWTGPSRAQAEAEAAYLKRQAELRAESEAADQRLAALNDKVKLVSLGFRDVAKKVSPAVVNVSNEREVPRALAEGARGRFF